jgi:hypothetical protein
MAYPAPPPPPTQLWFWPVALVYWLIQAYTKSIHTCISGSAASACLLFSFQGFTQIRLGFSKFTEKFVFVLYRTYNILE